MKAKRVKSVGLQNTVLDSGIYHPFFCLFPPGEVAPVQGTAFDLRKPVELGKHLQAFHINGFDHNFCLKESKEKHFCAR